MRNVKSIRKFIVEDLKRKRRGIWTEAMINSIKVDIQESENETTYTVYGVDYIEYMDEGVSGVGNVQTKSGRADKRFTVKNSDIFTGSRFSYNLDVKPPIEAIEPWANSKGLNPYAVRESIWRKGIKPMDFIVPAVDKFVEQLAEMETERQLNEKVDLIRSSEIWDRLSKRSKARLKNK